jgi:ammonia channel protein AmtB
MSRRHSITIFAGGMSAGVVVGTALSMPVNHFVFVIGGVVAGVMMCSFVTLMALLHLEEIE